MVTLEFLDPNLFVVNIKRYILIQGEIGFTISKTQINTILSKHTHTQTLHTYKRKTTYTTTALGRLKHYHRKLHSETIYFIISKFHIKIC